jgi:hypothetical protein
MLKQLDALLADVKAARDAAGKPKGQGGEVADREAYDEFKRAARSLEEARNWLQIHADRVAKK